MWAECGLNVGFRFDFAAIEVEPTKRPSSFYVDADHVDPVSLRTGTGAARRRYIPIASDRIDSLKVKRLSREFILEAARAGRSAMATKADLSALESRLFRRLAWLIATAGIAVVAALKLLS